MYAFLSKLICSISHAYSFPWKKWLHKLSSEAVLLVNVNKGTEAFHLPPCLSIYVRTYLSIYLSILKLSSLVSEFPIQKSGRFDLGFFCLYFTFNQLWLSDFGLFLFFLYFSPEDLPSLCVAIHSQVEHLCLFYLSFWLSFFFIGGINGFSYRVIVLFCLENTSHSVSCCFHVFSSLQISLALSRRRFIVHTCQMPENPCWYNCVESLQHLKLLSVKRVFLRL